jgi:hypothetical protein
LESTAAQPGPDVNIGDVTTGGSFNYIGGDYNQQFGQALTAIQNELDMTADPLKRLFYDSDEVRFWIDRRKAHLIETLVRKSEP